MMIAVGAYLMAITAANLLVAVFGPWVSPINAFVLIGLDLSLRDHLHEKWSGNSLWIKMLALIIASGLISFALNPASGMIAIASVASFVLSGMFDAAIYHWLRNKSYLIKSNGSNVGGAALDSVLFPTIAFGSFMIEIVLLQFFAKICGGFVWSILIKPPKQETE